MVKALFGPLRPDWEVVTLGEACARGGGDVQTGTFGSQLHASDYVPFGIPSIMPQNIGDNRIIANGIARIRPEDAERLNRYRVRPGDVIYSRRGDVEKRAGIRELWLVDLERERIEVLRQPAGGSYRTAETHRRGAQLTVEALPRLEFPVDAILG